MRPNLRATVLLALLVAPASHAGQRAATNPAELYSAAVSRQQALRALADGAGAPLRDYRAVVSAFDEIVRKHPASGYVDDALWRGAAVAREAYERFGEDRDRATARRMLALLVSDYPRSAYVPKARTLVNGLEPRPAAAGKPSAPPTAPASTSASKPPAASAPAPAPASAPLPKPPPASAPPPATTSAPTPKPPVASTPAPAPVSTPTPKSPPASASAPAPIRGPVSLARQLGLGAAKIVIDPGHGGHDPGALGAGVSEATVVLDVALRLEALLAEAGVDVVLTRRSDEFVPLDKRTAIATREQADLFLSIHINASRVRSARGVETYVLNFATDSNAEAVAARENAWTEQTISSLPDIVRAITLHSKLDESKSFARLVQRTLVGQLKPANKGIVDHGVKQAPFVVLVGAEMPSVLTELAFITNPQEERLLKSEAYRQRIAQALFDAVRGYQHSLKSAAIIPGR